MTAFRILLVLMFAVMSAYTAIVVSREGRGLVPVFVGDIAALTWRGQFNLDFITYLILSALWVCWRGGFTPLALALGAAASVLGIMFLAPYLLVALQRSGGDIRLLLLGVHAQRQAD